MKTIKQIPDLNQAAFQVTGKKCVRHHIKFVFTAAGE
jgi:hypothetical protein